MIALLLLLLMQGGARPPASISGTVIDADSVYRLPLVDARIEVSLPDHAPFVLRTGSEGQFSITNLVPGPYRLTVTANGFIRKSIPVSVAAGQQREGVVFALKLAPTITGRIKDEYNVPTAHLIVEAMKVIYGPRGDKSVTAFASTLTDDHGDFFLSWLDPGDYFIRATSLPATEGFALPGNPPEDPARRIYAPTYFPGTREPSEAVKTHVRVGTQVKGYEWKMQSGLAGLMGHVSTEATSTPVSTRIAILPAEYADPSRKLEARSGHDGEFQIAGIPVGDYVISAQTSLMGQALTGYRKFTLKGQERAFILTLSPGVTLNGQVGIADGSSLNLHSLKVVVDSVDTDLPSVPAVSVNDYGAFQLNRLPPGDYVVRIANLPGNAYVQSAFSGNTELLAQPLHVDYSPPVPVSMTLALNGGHLSGTVHDNENHSASGATAVLVPDAARRAIATYFQTVESDIDGVFELRGIAPGDYTLFAWQGIEPNAYRDALFLERYETLGTKVTISAGSDGAVSLSLIPLD